MLTAVHSNRILTLISRYPAAQTAKPTTARISITVTVAGCLERTSNKKLVHSNRKNGGQINESNPVQDVYG